MKIIMVIRGRLAVFFIKISPEVYGKYTTKGTPYSMLN